jgi:hypothetical protein
MLNWFDLLRYGDPSAQFRTLPFPARDDLTTLFTVCHRVAVLVDRNVTVDRVDRLMKFLDPAFFHAQYFHGMPDAAESRVRALALLWNFCPSFTSTRMTESDCPTCCKDCRCCRGTIVG